LTSSKKTDKSNEVNDSMFQSENVGKSKPRKKQTKKKQTEVVTEESSVGQYVHPNKKCKNNPPVGMVDPNNDPDQPSTRYSYDPRLDPQLQWSGKKENLEFDVDTVSLHVHERIDPLTIIEKAMKENKQVQQSLFNYFELPENNPPLRDAIEFYKHEQNWSNRLIAGDSLLIMNSLLQKENMEGTVQMFYIDPPYGIKYGSNFQPFVKTSIVKDGKDEDLTQEPEMIKAFRDTWELGIHSYLSYLRDRLILTHKLLHDTGSCFIQISDQNLHLVRNLMDEIFGPKNFVSLITFRTKIPLRTTNLAGISDYIVWYAKDLKKLKYHKLFKSRKFGGGTQFSLVELENGTRRRMLPNERKDPSLIPKNSKLFRLTDLVSSGRTESCVFEFELDGKKFNPSKGKSWKTNPAGIDKLIEEKRIWVAGKTPGYVFYHDDYPVEEITNLWNDTQGAVDKKYAVQTSDKVIQRCLLMTTDPGDLVIDPTCGAGTTAVICEKWGRRWMTFDTSRISVAIAKQRLVTSNFDYYQLYNSTEGIASNFRYENVPHITLGSITKNDQSQKTEILYDKPLIDKQKTRVSGPFRLEAVPSPTVKSIDVLSEPSLDQNDSKLIVQHAWRSELLISGIRGKGGQKIEFSIVESHPTTKWLHADAKTKESKPKRVMVSFGPEHLPLEQRQVSNAIEESRSLVPKPEIIIFAAMHFDPEAAKDIDQLNWPGVTILKAEMNKDLLTNDLKKKQSNSESFWLMGSPDVEYKKQQNGKYIVKVNGFDYYNTNTDEIESADSSKITMWELDTDYDGRSLYPQQIFFPMEGKTGGWNKLAKTLQGNIDEDLITKYQGTESIPFDLGLNKRIAIKIIDDRGIESLKIIDLE